MQKSERISLPVHKAKWFLKCYKDQLPEDIYKALCLYIDTGLDIDTSSELANMRSWLEEKIQDECTESLVNLLDNRPLGEDELKALGKQERTRYLLKLWMQYENILNYLTQTNEKVQHEEVVTLYQENFDRQSPQFIELFLEKMQVETRVIQAVMSGFVNNKYIIGDDIVRLGRDMDTYHLDTGQLSVDSGSSVTESYVGSFPIWIDYELLGNLVAHTDKTLFELLNVDEDDVDLWGDDDE